ncbi:MAG: polyisoprenyl-phosphate glycosyltransferase [Gaiellaceae bacterium]|jgi:dolichol-phosphate mannosyltransferase|nr:polyisoprenyl-phosphate glycosyltransferase [Gaiellaceae bacterium]
MRDLDAPVYSIVIPLHNEEECILELGRRLVGVIEELDGTTEVVFVDDGSTDASSLLIDELIRRDPRFRFIRLSRNFGHQIALTAGLEAARGAAVVTMDGDLQHPPEHIHALVEHWREGYDVVYGVMLERQDVSLFKRWSAAAFYRLLNRMADTDMPAAAGDFRLVDRATLDQFLQMREHHRYLRGMFAWMGLKQIGVPFASPARFGGGSKYTLAKMSSLAIDALLSFSNAPLRLALKVGFAVAFFSGLFAAASIASKLLGVYNAPGYVSIVAIVCMLGGVQLIVLGVIGEYQARIFEEVKGRPLYLVAGASESPATRPDLVHDLSETTSDSARLRRPLHQP